MVTTVAALFLSACQTTKPLENGETTGEPSEPTADHRSYCLQASMQDVPGHVILGYGSGRNLRSALGRAYGDLAEKLEVTVDATTVSTRKRDRAGDIQRELQERVETRAATDLSNVERICLDQDDPAGDTHVAVRVDLRSPATIVAEELAGRWNGVPETIEWRGPAALLQGEFLRAVRESLASRPARAGEIAPRLDLYRRAGQWHLAIGGARVSAGKATLGEFIDWQAAERGPARLFLVDENGSRLRSQMPDGDEFRIRLEGGDGGLLTLLAGHPDGSLSALRENVPLAGNRTVPAPPGVFSAEVDREGQSTRIHFVALVADEPINIAPWLAPRGESGDPQAFLEWLERKTFTVATSEILVIPTRAGAS